MRTKRDAFVRHLQKIMCGGQVTEAIFNDAFATQALTPDHLLLVLAPPLPSTDTLAEPIGVPSIALLIKSLEVLAGTGEEAVDVEVGVTDDHRLLIDEFDRGEIELLVANPKTIATRIDDATVKKLMTKAPKKGGIPLTKALVDGIKNTWAMMKAAEVELFLGPKGGEIHVGNDNSNRVKFPAPELKSKQSYSLLFGEHLVNVLSVVSDFSSAIMHVGGPEEFIMVEDGGYQYIMSPRSKGADAATPAATEGEAPTETPADKKPPVKKAKRGRGRKAATAS